MDHSGAHYSETQKLPDIMKILFAILMLVATPAMLIYVFFDISRHVQDAERSRAMLIFFAVNIPVIIIDIIAVIIIFKVRMEIALKSDGLYVSMFPVKIRPEKILLENIEKITIEEINVRKEFGKGGCRKKNGNSLYTLMSSRGIKILYNTGNYTFIGSTNPEQFMQWLKNLNYVK